MDEWDDVDRLIDERREVLAVREIWYKLGCSLPEAHRVFGERATARRIAREQQDGRR